MKALRCGKIIILICCILHLTACGGQTGAAEGPEETEASGGILLGLLPMPIKNGDSRERTGMTGEIMRDVLSSGIEDGYDRGQTGTPEKTQIFEEKPCSVYIVLSEANGAVLQAVQSTVRYSGEYAGQLTRMAAYMLNERKMRSIFAECRLVECRDPEIIKMIGSDFPEGVIEEFFKACWKGSVMDFIHLHAADYEILSDEEIEEYTEANEVLYNFREEMEGEYIWYRLSLDSLENLVICGEHSYQFGGKDTEQGFQLPDGDPYFVCWGEENLIVFIEEKAERVLMYYDISDYHKGNAVAMKRTRKGIDTCYYRYDIWQ